MGGDHGCGVVMEGAKRALQLDSDITTLFLIGDKEQIHRVIPSGGFRDHRVQMIHASEVLTMTDKPASAVRKKKDCSMVRAIDLVHEGKADAVISLGNTGGLVGIGYWQAAVCDITPAGIAKAIRYAVNVAGIEHVGLGSDFDGATTTLFDTSQLVLVTDALLQAGFSPVEIEAIMGGNALRVLRAGLPQK